MTRANEPERRRGPLHPGLIASGATLLIGVFVTDFLYWKTLLFQWNNVSEWLLAAGLVLAGLAAIAFVVDLALRRVTKIAWLSFAGLALAALLSLLNAFVHSRDAYTAVVPEGITLSAIVAVILIVLGVVGGWSLESRHTRPLPQIREVRP